jgi:16S rRNA (guanine527-N7)-methyltransferase
LAKTSIILSDHQKQQLISYVEMLNKWNKAYNLTSVRDPNEMIVKHILDSLVVAPHLEGDNYIDVGTGPGLPGVILAIAHPDKHFVLLDSLGKRIRFLNQVKLNFKTD